MTSEHQREASARHAGSNGPPLDRYDLEDPALFLDPHPLLHRMRSEDPVHWSPQLGSWALTAYGDVSAVFRDPRFSVVEEIKRVEAQPTADQLELRRLRRRFEAWGDRGDPQAHARFVSVMKRNVTPRRVESLRPRIQQTLDGLVDAALARGELDVVNDVAHPLAMTVVAELCGIPIGRLDLLMCSSRAITGLLERGSREQLYACQQAMDELSEYLRPVVRSRREAPRGDLISVFVEADPGGTHYDDEYVIAQCLMFLVVGYHTTANQICNGLQILFDHPAERALLAATPQLLPNAIDEMMRFHSSVASVRRMAIEDVALRDKHVKAGDTVTLIIAAANHDPATFPDPDRFDPRRPNANRQLGFTIGPYSCMGQALARLEAEVTFGTLLGRFPRLRPRDATPDWVRFHPLGRELATLRVLVD
jgi:cytochrome P450